MQYLEEAALGGATSCVLAHGTLETSGSLVVLGLLGLCFGFGKGQMNDVFRGLICFFVFMWGLCCRNETVPARRFLICKVDCAGTVHLPLHFHASAQVLESAGRLACKW